MKKSAEEFESLIGARDLIKTQMAQEKKHEGFINMFTDLPELKMPDSVVIMARLTKRITDSRILILTEELKNIEDKIAEYNNIFTSAAG